MGMALRLGLNLSTALSSPRGGLSAAWSADFTAGVLPAGVSVSSPSLGGLVTDSTGRLTYKPNNIIPDNANPNAASWHTGNVTGNTGVADPLGGSNAFTLTATAASAYAYPANSANAGPNWMASVWLRRRTGVGVVTVKWIDGSTSTPALTTSWQQVSHLSTSFTYQAGVQLAIATAGDAIDVYLPIASAVTYETTPRAADQVITGASAYYGPAWDYDPVNVGVPLGLRIWEGRTNYLLNSNGVSDATVRGATVTPGAIGPDGTASATSLTVGAKTSQDLYKTVQGLPSPSTFSFYIKRTSTSGTLHIENPYGAGGVWDVSMSALPNRWERIYEGHPAVTVVSPFATSQQGFWFSCASGTVSFDFYGAQINDGSTVSPLIPTGASAVTAAADVVTLGGVPLALLQGVAGTAVIEASGLNTPGTVNAILSTNNGDALPIYYNSGGNSLKGYNGTTNLISNMFPVVSNTLRYGTSWSAAGRSLTYGGNAPASDNLVFSPAVTSVQIGGATGYSTVDGYVRKLALYNTRLPDFALQSRSVVGASLTS